MRQHIVWRDLKGVFDHFEGGGKLCLAINGPIRVEDFVTTVFRVCLRKHAARYRLDYPNFLKFSNR